MVKIFGGSVILLSFLNILFYAGNIIVTDHQAKYEELKRIAVEQQYLVELIDNDFQLSTGSSEVISDNGEKYIVAYETVVRQLSALQEDDELFNSDAQYENLFSTIQKEWQTLFSAVLSKEPVDKAHLKEQLQVLDQHYENLSNNYNSQLQRVGRISWWLTLLFYFLQLSFGAALLWTMYNLIHKPIQNISEMSERIADGDLSGSSKIKSFNELDRIPKALEKIVQNQVTIAAFADEIGKNNFEGNYEFNLKNQLGISLSRMRDQLKNASLEDQRRLWANEGYNEFTDLLRSNQDDLEKMGNEIISKLVKYVKANQGALFILQKEEEEQYLELTATYAWGRKKFIDKKVGLKEGLLGQAVLEADTIYITNVPTNFVNITSGLGHANPSCILIVPLKINDTIHGVLELASLHKMEPYQREFVEKLGESIASVLSNIGTNQQTKKLLEESQQMTEQMKLQEEELRQNSEELEAARENLSRQLEEATGEMKLRIQEIEGERKKNIAVLEGCVDGVISFNQNGEIEFLNKAVEEIWGIDRKHFLGKAINELLPVEFIRDDTGLHAQYLWNGEMKPIDIRTEVMITSQLLEEVYVLLTLSEACVGDETTFTLFVQKISVELF